MVKLTKYVLPAMAGAALLLSSCAEDPVKDITVDMPNSIKNKVDYSYLGFLSEANPSVNLSVAVDVADYSSNGTSSIIAAKNFNEVTANKEMYFSSCVDKKGNWTFSKVRALVEKAQADEFGVYGQNLIDLANLPVDYLNYILQDKRNPNSQPVWVEKEMDPRKCIAVETLDKVSQSWDTQFWIVSKKPFAKGDKVVLKADVRSLKETATEFGTQYHSKDCYYKHYQALGAVKFTTEWNSITLEAEVPAEGDGTQSIALSLNDDPAGNIYYWDNVSLTINGEEQIENGDFEKGTEHEQFRRIKWYSDEKDGSGNTLHDAQERYAVAITDKVLKMEEVTSGSYWADKPEAPRNCIAVETLDKVSQSWDTQFWIVSKNAFKKGDKVVLKADVKSKKETATEFGTQYHSKDCYYKHYQALGAVKFTTSWNTITLEAEVPAEGDGTQSIALSLNDDPNGNVYYWDNVSLTINGVEQIENGDFETGTQHEQFRRIKWYSEEKDAAGNTLHDAQERYAVAITDKVFTAEEVNVGGKPLTEQEKMDTIHYAVNHFIASMMQNTYGYVKNWDAVVDPFADGEFDLKAYYGKNFVSEMTTIIKQFAGNASNDLKLFVAVNDAQIAENLDPVIAGLKDWADISGIHAKVTLASDDVAAAKASIDAMLDKLAKTGKTIRVTINSIECTGSSDALSDAETADVAEIYNYVASKCVSVLGSNLQGLALGAIKNNNNSAVLFDASYSRNQAYKGFVLGLKGQSL
ncbi:MAG: endo-1,4-beta-xylanase [Bacteroidales bacterium]|nr:endo-1,4-beta-xylanase [Bacteroidales bacterium]